MLAKRIRVIKRDQIQAGSPAALPLGRIPTTGGSAEDRSSSVTAGPAQARIMESNSDYVILEIVCGCGRKSFVQCNYGNVAGPQNLQEIQP